MRRHRFHGNWNYSLRPQHRDTAGVVGDPRPAEGLPSQCLAGGLRNPGLTGMTEPALDALVDQLSQRLDEPREHERSRQRGGDRIRTRGAGAKDKLTTADRVLATVLYLRKLGTRDLIAQLFGVNGRHHHQGLSASPAPPRRERPHQPTLGSQAPHTRRRHRVHHQQQHHGDQVSMLILCEPSGSTRLALPPLRPGADLMGCGCAVTRAGWSPGRCRP